MRKRIKQSIPIFLLVIAILAGCFRYMNSTASLTQSSSLEVSVETYCLMDADSGQVILQKNMDTQMRPASITKILTALIVVESVENLEEEMTFSENAVIYIGTCDKTWRDDAGKRRIIWNGIKIRQ